MKTGDKVLISGGSGLIGQALTKALRKKGTEVVHLSRKAGIHSGVKAFEWDVEKGTIDLDAFDGVTHIVHLAGAGIADKRWTQARKKVLIDSRTQSAHLLLEGVKKANLSLRIFVSASGINYYGLKDNGNVFIESDPPGKDFLANTTVLWEEAADLFKEICPVVKLRTSLVLSPRGGALKQLSAPVKLGFGAPLGNGKQWLPWISLRDLVAMYIYALDGNLQGVYNAVAPEFISNKEITKRIAKALHKPLWLPPVPGFLLKLVLGELADTVLCGVRASSAKIQEAGFQFTDTDSLALLKQFFNDPDGEDH